MEGSGALNPFSIIVEWVFYCSATMYYKVLYVKNLIQLNLVLHVSSWYYIVLYTDLLVMLINRLINFCLFFIYSVKYHIHQIMFVLQPLLQNIIKFCNDVTKL